MLRKRIHNIIDFYPLPLSVTLLRASGIRRAGRKCLEYFGSVLARVPSKSSPRPQRHIFSCVRLTVVHWLYFLSFCALIVRINTG